MEARSRARRLARTALVAAVVVGLLAPAAWHVAAVARIVWARIGYPMDIEWLEGGQVYHSFRILHGLPIYGPPSQGFVPYPYPPAYWVVVAGAGAIFGLDWWTGRAVAVACLAVVLLVQGIELWRASPGRAFGATAILVAIGGALAAYPTLGGTYDHARMDTMNVALAVTAATLVTTEGSVTRTRAWLIGAVIAADVYTKQTNVFFGVWIVAFLLLRDRRAGARAASSAVVLCVLALVVLQFTSRGWFWTWIVSLKSHELVWGHFRDAVSILARSAPFDVLLPLVALALHRARALTARAVLWLGMLGAAFLATLLPALSVHGGFSNYIPVCLLSWFVAIRLLCDAWRALAGWPRVRLVLGAVLLSASAEGLQALEYAPEAFVPAPERWRDAETFHAFVRALDGTVLLPIDPLVPARDGKGDGQISLVAYMDAFHDGRGVNVQPGDGVERSRPRWVLSTGTDIERGCLLPPIEPRYALDREVDLGTAPPTRVQVFRRRDESP